MLNSHRISFGCKSDSEGHLMAPFLFMSKLQLISWLILFSSHYTWGIMQKQEQNQGHKKS